MKLQLRPKRTPRELAELHFNLMTAAEHIKRAVYPGGTRVTVTRVSNDALWKLRHKLVVAATGLERGFVEATEDMGSPFASESNPSAWLEYLDKKAGEAK